MNSFVRVTRLRPGSTPAQKGRPDKIIDREPHVAFSNARGVTFFLPGIADQIKEEGGRQTFPVAPGKTHPAASESEMQYQGLARAKRKSHGIPGLARVLAGEKCCRPTHINESKSPTPYAHGFPSL